MSIPLLSFHLCRSSKWHYSTYTLALFLNQTNSKSSKKCCFHDPQVVIHEIQNTPKPNKDEKEASSLRISLFTTCDIWRFHLILQIWRIYNHESDESHIQRKIVKTQQNNHVLMWMAMTEVQWNNPHTLLELSQLLEWAFIWWNNRSEVFFVYSKCY